MNGLPLGPDAIAIWIDNPKIEDAFLWRPTKGLTRVGEAIGTKVAWPKSKVIIETINTTSSINHTSNVGVVEKVCIKLIYMPFNYFFIVQIIEAHIKITSLFN